MKSLRWRLTAWFALSLLVVVAVLVVSAHWHLDYELRKEKWERSNPNQPDWILHGSFTDKEVRDILGELLQFWVIVGVPTVGLVLVAAYFLGRRSTRPVRKLNDQLTRLGATTLGQRVEAPDADPEIAELVQHLNDLLARLETSFTQLREYSSQVAHELRTPLQLMKLQIENNAAKMEPELAEDLQEELARLSTYVETALTIARAEQGRLETSPETLPLKEFLTDVVEPFSRLATADRRRLLWACPANVVACTDRNLLKQILFNLLSNALKHGREDILLRARVCEGAVWVLLGNRVRNIKTVGAAGDGNGLGIGLRLVRALASQLNGTRLTFRTQNYFWVRLRVPAGQPPANAVTSEAQYEDQIK
ncbi:MAG TPA: HAMP domain-containing sensor histidine kinase [Verrucomicrobiae bacterium]|nr:HAMP domain-containing sensor histidine kinase [Verrucomicrobiae bacterium]